MSSLLNISERAAIALHAVGALARNPEAVTSTKEIALLERVSEAHLAKVMRQLVNAGIVSSTVGPGGGFLLVRQPDELTLLEVFELIDGPVGHTYCMLTPPREDCAGCVFKQLTEPVNSFVRKFLATITVADMANPANDLVVKLQEANLMQIPSGEQPTGGNRSKGGNRGK